MAGKGHLEGPFFEPAHRAMAREADAWCGTELDAIYPVEGEDSRCRALVAAMGAAGFLRHPIVAREGGSIDVRSACILREVFARRILTFLAFSHGNSQALNWQVEQSLISFGSGGMFARGFGHSEQKLSWLPDSYTDFIFSIVGEEGGILLTLAVSGAFLFLALRGLRIAHECSDRFGQLLGVGITASVSVYAALNMYVATGLFPVTGLPLPFLIYGGSALIVNAFSVGVLQNLSRRAPAAQRRPGSGWHPLSVGVKRAV